MAPNNSSSKKDKKDILLTFWEIVAVIHTFSGSIMIAAVTTKLTHSALMPMFMFGLGIFFVNLYVIFKTYDLNTGKFNQFNLLLAFWLAMITMMIFSIALITATYPELVT